MPDNKYLRISTPLAVNLNRDGELPLAVLAHTGITVGKNTVWIRHLSAMPCRVPLEIHIQITEGTLNTVRQLEDKFMINSGWWVIDVR